MLQLSGCLPLGGAFAAWRTRRAGRSDGARRGVHELPNPQRGAFDGAPSPHDDRRAGGVGLAHTERSREGTTNHIGVEKKVASKASGTCRSSPCSRASSVAVSVGRSHRSGEQSRCARSSGDRGNAQVSATSDRGNTQFSAATHIACVPCRYLLEMLTQCARRAWTSIGRKPSGSSLEVSAPLPDVTLLTARRRGMRSPISSHDDDGKSLARAFGYTSPQSLYVGSPGTDKTATPMGFPRIPSAALQTAREQSAATFGHGSFAEPLPAEPRASSFGSQPQAATSVLWTGRYGAEAGSGYFHQEQKPWLANSATSQMFPHGGVWNARPVPQLEVNDVTATSAPLCYPSAMQGPAGGSSEPRGVNSHAAGALLSYAGSVGEASTTANTPLAGEISLGAAVTAEPKTLGRHVLEASQTAGQLALEASWLGCRKTAAYGRHLAKQAQPRIDEFANSTARATSAAAARATDAFGSYLERVREQLRQIDQDESDETDGSPSSTSEASYQHSGSESPESSPRASTGPNTATGKNIAQRSPSTGVAAAAQAQQFGARAARQPTPQNGFHGHHLYSSSFVPTPVASPGGLVLSGRSYLPAVQQRSHYHSPAFSSCPVRHFGAMSPSAQQATTWRSIPRYPTSQLNGPSVL